MCRDDSIGVHIREKSGIFLLAGVSLATWGCGSGGDEGTITRAISLGEVARSPTWRTPSPVSRPMLAPVVTATARTRLATGLPTRPPTPTPVPEAVIQIGTATGLPGEMALVDVTLTWVSLVAEIAGVQNDIGFDLLAGIAEREGGKPDCVVNPDIDKAATDFAFQPGRCSFDGCTGGCSGDECAGIRAIVLAFDNSDPILEGSVLYTCSVAISPEAEPGSVFPLTCSKAIASDPEGNRVGLRCDDAQILVGGE